MSRFVVQSPFVPPRCNSSASTLHLPDSVLDRSCRAMAWQKPRSLSPVWKKGGDCAWLTMPGWFVVGTPCPTPVFASWILSSTSRWLKGKVARSGYVDRVWPLGTGIIIPPRVKHSRRVWLIIRIRGCAAAIWGFSRAAICLSPGGLKSC